MSRKSVEKNIAYDDIRDTYYVTLYYGTNDKGKHIRKTKTFDKISDARRALITHEAEKIKGTLVKPRDTTLEEWLEYWMTNIIIPNREATTAYGYRNMIDNHIVPDLGKIPIQDLKPQRLQAFYTRLLKVKGLSPNTVRKQHDLLKTALQVAVKQEVILTNPITKVEAPKKTDTDIKFYSQEDLKKLFSVIEGDPMEVVVKLAGYLGLRREEISGLKWSNVNFDNKLITINHARTMAGGVIVEKKPKNKTSIRTLYMIDEIYNLLQNLKDKREKAKAFYEDEYMNTDFIVVWDNGKPYRPDYMSDRFTRLVEKNNLPRITLHGLRHTFASVANSLGVPMYDIGKALGHSTPATTGKIYTHLLDNNHQDTLNKIAESLNK